MLNNKQKTLENLAQEFKASIKDVPFDAHYDKALDFLEEQNLDQQTGWDLLDWLGF